jgi:glycosyltransferase involved in cell wall biosynthesis
MKVLQVSKFYPPIKGGIESVVYELTTGLSGLGFDVDVLCSNTRRTTSRERERGVKGEYSITRAGSLGRILSTSLSPALIAEARRLRSSYDVIHVQMPDPMAALALWYARPTGRVVVHWQSDVVNQKRALFFYEPLQRWLLKRADAIIATTPPYAESSPWLAPFARKVAIIPIGISDFSASLNESRVREIREKFGGKKLIFSLGRMTYYKGFDVLIEAAATIPDNSVIVVGGGGELLSTHRAHVRHRGLERKIYFIGRIPDDDIAAYFAACDVFCLPSVIRAEAYGVVLLEAMAMGKPLVATDIKGSGVAWVNQHRVTGLNVPVRDASALSTALRELLENDQLAENMGRAARRRFTEHLTADLMVSAIADLYRRLTAVAPSVKTVPT